MFGDVKIRIRSKLSVVMCLLITVVLAVLKLINIVDLPWWVVLIPVYGPLIVAAVIYLTFCVYNIIENKRVEKQKEEVSKSRLEQLEKRKARLKSD